MKFQMTEADPNRTDFDHVESRRAKLGVSQSQLCRAADVSESTYWKLIRNTSRVPNFRTVKRLKTALLKWEN